MVRERELEPWVGVDLDGTLAQYDGWQGSEHIGPPVPRMVERVRAMIAEGRKVKIFTARVSGPRGDVTHVDRSRELIRRWVLEHVGQDLEVTCVKDYGMVLLLDDRAQRIVHNTGENCCERPLK